MGRLPDSPRSTMSAALMCVLAVYLISSAESEAWHGAEHCQAFATLIPDPAHAHCPEMASNMAHVNS